jgi:hypothetical protein
LWLNLLRNPNSLSAKIIICMQFQTVMLPYVYSLSLSHPTLFDAINGLSLRLWFNLLRNPNSLSAKRCLQAIPDRYAIVCVFLLSLSLSVSVSSLSHPVLFDAIDGGSSHLWFNIAGKP